MKILLVEDDPKSAQFTKQCLVENFYEVDLAYDGLIAKQLAIRNIYDIIITGIILPGLDGYTLIKELRNAGIQTPIMILSIMSEPADKVKGFDTGADQYLVKPFQFDELLAMLRALTRRSSGVNITAHLMKFDSLEVNLDTKLVKRRGKIIELTAQEFRLLEYFLRNQGRVLSKAQIAENVWGINFDKGTNYVEVYINYLRNKIDKNYEKKLIHTIFGMGYVMRDE